jgi:hypothetical protein
MNERIRQLAEQAGIYKLNLSDETEYWIMEKFAQLIVERLCYDMMDVCGATQAERIQFVAKDWGVEL